MSSLNPKLALFAQFAAVAKALAHTHRLHLLEQLAQGERSVEVLADRTGVSVANASQHLQHMLRAGLVANRRDGKFVYYRLADEAVIDLLTALRKIAEQNVAEVERVMRSYFEIATAWSRSRARNCWTAPARTGSRFWTCGPKMNLPWATCRARSTFRCGRLKRAFRNWTRRKKSSRTAVDPIAYCPTRQSQPCANAGLRRSGSKMVCRSGVPPG